MQSVLITYKFKGCHFLNPTHGQVYFIQPYVIKFVSRLMVFTLYSTNKTVLHDISEILFESGIKIPITL